MDKPTETSVQPYLNAISLYEREFSKWEKRADKIIKRYRDERSVNSNQTHYNILWANVQTLKAATFSRMPKPDVSRRFKDNDPVARVASTLIERALDFEITHGHDFKETITAAVYDRFLGGRGTAWVRYEPIIETEDFSVSEQDLESDTQAEYLDIETTPVDYVHWKDFGHNVARTWDEVTMVWRKVYMTREMLKERFPENDLWKKIPLDSSPEEEKTRQTEAGDKKALIIEIWNKETKTVCWISKSLGKVIDERDDPLGLEDFWPCPKPLFSTITNETLVPVPDFTLYQDQAMELDTLAERIKGLIDALKVRGVYDAASPELGRLFTEGANNTLIPVSNFQAFAEKNGLKGSIDLVDITPIANALNVAYTAMGQVKQQIYDVTGISDIIRGASNANETATAQQIKGQYASLRLKSFQDEVANFASNILKIKAQIICQQFQTETILKIGGAELLNDADKQLIPQALQLIKDNPMRTFRIEVAADSMLYQDEQQEKQDRVEFLTATSSFIEKAVQGAQVAPDLVPLMMDLLKFGVQGYRVGRSLEGEFDNTADMMKQKMAQPKPPQPNPEQMKMQMQSAIEDKKIQADMQKHQSEQQMRNQELQLEAQRDQMKAQHQAEVDMHKAQLDMQERQHEAELKERMHAREMDYNEWKTKLEAETKVLVAQIGAESKKVGVGMEGEEVSEDMNTQSALTVALQGFQAALNDMSRPKQVIRDVSGKIVGVQ